MGNLKQLWIIPDAWRLAKNPSAEAVPFAETGARGYKAGSHAEHGEPEVNSENGN